MDGNGRPILQPDPSEPTRKLFQGLPVKVFPDAQLANIDATHFPVIYGDTKAGVDFMDYQELLLEVSEHYLFNKNQNCMQMCIRDRYVCLICPSSSRGAYGILSFLSGSPWSKNPCTRRRTQHSHRRS